MQLIVGAAPFSQWQPLSELMHSLGWNPGTQSQPEHWACHADKTPDATFLLLYTPAPIAVAKAMDNGLQPSAAMRQWQSGVQQLLDFYRKNRRQTLLINETQAQQDPQALQILCEQRWNISATHPVAACAVQKVSLLHQLLAQQLVAQETQLTELLAELEVSTTPLQKESVTTAIDIDELHQLLSQQAAQCAEHAGLQQQLDKAQQENDLLTTQLHQAQEELESQHEKNLGNEQAAQQQKAQIDTLIEKLKQLKIATHTLKNEHDRALAERQQLQQSKQIVKDENNLLISQLHQVQEELEVQYQKILSGEQTAQQYKTQIDTLSEELKQIHSTAAALKQERDNIRQELQSQKINAEKQHQELASQKDENSRQHKQLKETQEENDLIIAQLHQVQEELERYYFNNQALNQEKQKLQQALDHTMLQLQQSQQRLNTLSKSVSWKITSPIRILGKLFRKATPELHSLKQQLKLLKRSDLFDADWYLKTYPDVATSGIDPYKHYLKFGAQEGRDPSPYFTTNWYQKAYPDVVATGQNPLIHYLKFGQQEGREKQPVG